MTRQIPGRFTKKWWRLWRSGAIPRDTVYFNYLAEELERYLRDPSKAEYHQGWDDPEVVRRGQRLQKFTRGFVDLCARCSSDLRLPWKYYLEFTTRLFGKPATELF